MAELLFHRGGEPVVRLPLDRDRVHLGHGPDNDIVLPAAAVDREEARLELRAGGWYLHTLAGEDERRLCDGAVLDLKDGWSAVFREGAPTTYGETRRAAAGGATLVRAVAAPSGAPLRLRWYEDGRECHLPLHGTTVALGSDPGNTVVLSDDYVSAFHARLVPGPSGWRVTDLGSTNGTFVDGVQVREADLLPGAVLRLGERGVHLEPDVETARLPAHGLLTGDSGMQAILEQVDRIAAGEATVTIFGESGTGKELVARALHLASDRHAGPYIPVNCAAISRDLLESELFGHERGAFTGATAPRAGAFEEADGGTLFLDEVGEIPLELQAKLLRALELKEIRRVGTNRPLHVDVRIVAATHRDLYREAKAGRFREDLFYRLFVVPLTLPPLRRRPGDVLLLTEHFLRQRAVGAPPPLTDAAREKLLEHEWPGNVRELKNTLERALLLRAGPAIDEGDLVFPAALLDGPKDDLVSVEGKTWAEIEAEVIEVALALNDGNRRRTAEQLGLARSTLQRKLRELGMLLADD